MGDVVECTTAAIRDDVKPVECRQVLRRKVIYVSKITKRRQISCKQWFIFFKIVTKTFDPINERWCCCVVEFIAGVISS